MWKKIVPLLVILSVTLNIGVAGVWIAHTVNGGGLAGNQPDEGTEGIWCPLHRDLGVTEEQWENLEPGLLRFQENLRPVCQNINLSRDELIDLLDSPEPDLKAIESKQREINLGQQQVQQLVIEHLLAEKQILTTQQQAQLFNMVRQQSACTMSGFINNVSRQRGMSLYPLQGGDH